MLCRGVGHDVTEYGPEAGTGTIQLVIFSWHVAYVAFPVIKSLDGKGKPRSASRA